MQTCELIYLVTTIACTISKCCSEDEIAILAAAFTQLGDTLTTTIVNKEILEKGKKKEENLVEDVEATPMGDTLSTTIVNKERLEKGKKKEDNLIEDVEA